MHVAVAASGILHSDRRSLIPADAAWPVPERAELWGWSDGSTLERVTAARGTLDILSSTPKFCIFSLPLASLSAHGLRATTMLSP